MNFGIDSLGPLPANLQARLNMIIQTVPLFWSDNKYYNHFTNHGAAHSERVHNQKLAQLAQELPESSRLTSDEIFIVSAAAWLYEVGMQSPDLQTIGIDFRPGDSLSFSQLQQVREKRHLLTESLIINCVRRDYSGPPLQLGLASPGDDYTQLIAEVCRWCSNEALVNVPETLPAGGLPVRVRLLVALLRLADQLYIDRSRVNLDLLERADLPEDQFARWWVYHYAQTLPIVRGQIRFHYFLPVNQKEYLGHIRALIEPRFKYENNPTIQYLWEEGLRITPHRTPSVKFDPPDGFQQEMSPQITSYFRKHVPPMEVSSEILSLPSERSEELTLLLLDYENMILQLGQEGYFFRADEISDLVVKLLVEARSQYGGLVDGWAIGHWHRPDLTEVAQTLKAYLYELVPVRSGHHIPEQLAHELAQRLQATKALRRVIWVTPHVNLASHVKKLVERKQPTSVWISELPEADIYRAVVQDYKILRTVVNLSGPAPISSSEFEMSETAFILRLDDEMTHHGGVISLNGIYTVLEQVERVSKLVSWWQLWLIHQEIIVLDTSNELCVARLNSHQPDVTRVLDMRRAVIETLQLLSQGEQGVWEDDLTKELRHFPHFRHQENTIGFLDLLVGVGLVRRDAGRNLPGYQPLWYLNPSHPAVAALNAELSIPRSETISLKPTLPIQTATMYLDVTALGPAYLDRPFGLAFSMLQSSYPALIARKQSASQPGEVKVLWSGSEVYIPVQLQVYAPDCKIHGPSTYPIRCFPNMDSPVYHFHVTPKKLGDTSVIINVFQNNDWVGSARTDIVVQQEQASSGSPIEIVRGRTETITYVDFELHITPDGHVRARSTEGERVAQSPIAVPSSIRLALALVEEDRVNEDLLRNLGRQLYELVFPGPIHTHFNQTEAVARREQKNIRIRLTIESDKLACLPLEFMYRDEGGYFIAANPATVLSRYLNLPMPQERGKKQEEPLHLLIIIANPTDQTQLDVDNWEQIILGSLANPIRGGLITTKTVKLATFEQIRDALLEKQPDIVQFVGHGTYLNARGYLALVDTRTNMTWLVDDARFANIFLGSDGPPGLVLLATCESARSDSPQGFLGIAPQMVQRGIPAVVAMQYPILVSSAEIFLENFYRALAERKPVDWAVQQARNAVSIKRGLDNREFATPVLYMRAKDGNVFGSPSESTDS